MHQAREKRVCETEIGVLALWDSDSFPMVYSQETWEAEVLDERARQQHVSGGYLVPIRLDSPGAFEVEVRASWGSTPAALTEREAAQVVASSKPYLFRCSGRVCFGGLECVDSVQSTNAGNLDIDAGDYEARIHLLDWQADPDAVAADGLRSQTGLADVLVLLNRPGADFRPSVSPQTFR